MSREHHIVERLAERYGVQAAYRDVAELDAAARGQSLLQHRYPDGTERRLVLWRGAVMSVVFKPNPIGVIVTVLPKECLRSRDSRPRKRWRRLRNH